MNQTPYIFARESFDFYFAYIESAIIPLLKELEAAGLYDFWKENRLPVIKEKCEVVDQYLDQYNVEHLIGQFRCIDSSDFTVYMCSFAKPHGIKLCGNNLISDCSYKDDTILSNVTHEAFHPAFDFGIVQPSLDTLAAKPWVQHAYENQSPNSHYYPIEGFIEEHIAEALGIYVLAQLGVDIDPMEYFNTHDGGSHVISPYFYQYLCETPKQSGESFEDYFTRFVDGLNEEMSAK